MIKPSLEKFNDFGKSQSLVTWPSIAYCWEIYLIYDIFAAAASVSELLRLVLIMKFTVSLRSKIIQTFLSLRCTYPVFVWIKVVEKQEILPKVVACNVIVRWYTENTVFVKMLHCDLRWNDDCHVWQENSKDLVTNEPEEELKMFGDSTCVADFKFPRWDEEHLTQ